MRPRTRPAVAALSGVPFTLVLSNSMLIPVLPAIMGALDLSLLEAGLIITAFSIPAAVTIPFAGFLSDRLGRKTVMLPSLVVFGLGGLAAGVAAMVLEEPYAAMMAARVVQGLGGGGTYQLAMALAGDIFSSAERSKVMGILEAANGTGKVISPIIGSAAALLTWFAPFFVYPAVAIPVAVGAYALVSEPERPAGRPLEDYASTLRDIFRTKGLSVLVVLLAGLAALFLLFGVLSLVSDVLESRHGIRGLAKGFLIAAPVLAMAATSFAAGTLMQDRLARFSRGAVVVGFALATAGLGAIPAAAGPASLVALTTLVGLGVGLVLPALNTLITSATGALERGLVTSLYGTARFLGAATGPPAFAWALRFGAAAPPAGAAAAAALVGTTVLLLLKASVMLPPELQGDSRGSAP